MHCALLAQLDLLAQAQPLFGVTIYNGKLVMELNT
jgi:hypothetical protein